MSQISPTAIIHKNVHLGRNVIIEDYCIIGCQPTKGFVKQATTIGDQSIIRAGTIIYAGNKIGSHFQTGNKANIRELNEIGDHVSIGTLSIVEYHIQIENHVRIHSQVFIPEFTVLKEKSWLGPNVVLTNAKYPRSPEVKNNLKGPIVGENAIIGANSTILPAVRIGANSLIAAGSLVTGDVKSDSVYLGNPAKFIKRKSELPYS